MKARLILSLCAVGAAIAVGSCSPGIGNNPQPTTSPTQTAQASTNLPVGLDIGLQPTDPIVEPSTTGVVVPAIGSFPERDIVLLAFATDANAADGDGSGTALSRDAVTDSNGTSDIFLAAVCAQDVDTRAFSQSLAGKFRHPRCATCHSMQRSDTLAFVSSSTSSQVGGAQPHAGPPPGPTFPSNDPATCIPCHTNSTAAPVEAWQAPAASFDLRSKTVAELAVAAQNVPADETEHFVTDPRVIWALDSGILPTVGGRNGVADDDHDGIDEPSDRDGVPRPVPGGSEVFIQQIEDWNDSGNLVTAAGAVTDITLVSRATGTSNAGNGASSQAQVIYVPNGSFSAPGTVGTIYIVYQSDASDLVAGDSNGATDVFRTAVDLISDASGNLDLVVNGNATLVSSQNGAPAISNGASSMAVVGGANGDIVAFQSLSTNLVAGFTDANGASAADIYVRDITNQTTVLVSHQTSNQATGGDGASTVPAIDATGVGVAFESDATDLISGDTNSVRDVFFADVSGTAPFTKTRASVSNASAEGTGGNCADATIFVNGGRTLVAFESDKADLDSDTTATTNVFLYDSDSNTTTLLNQVVSTSSSEVGDGSARNPAIGADGSNVAFESDATNIDVLRDDGNDVTDVFLVDVTQALAGTVLPYRFSLTTVEATDGDGASTEPRFSTFSSSSSTYGIGFATYTTAATNLGTADSTNLVVAFLDETSGVLTDFSVSATSGAAPLTVTFTDDSTGVPTEWAWDFDNDGNVDSTEQNPTHTYTTAGTYSVKLFASNAVSSNETTKANLVRAIGLSAPDFTSDTTSGPASLTVNFTDTSTEQPTSWLWDFGDGASSTSQNPSHVYSTPGTYTVALTATNEAGAATETKANYITVFTPVVAGFTPSVTSGTVSFPVTFTNTSTGASSYLWDFGDGSATVTTESPTHTYTSSGTFTVTLTATGDGGVDMATTMITANGAVGATFTISVDAGPTGAIGGYVSSTINLDASGSANATGFSWSITGGGGGGGSLAATATPSGSIATLFPTTSETTYTITLNTTGPGGTGMAQMMFTSVADNETVTIECEADNTIYSENANSYGMGDGMVVGRTDQGPGNNRRGLLQFDIAGGGGIPSGATVNTAELRLTLRAPNNPHSTGAQTLSIHKLTRAWTEGSSSTGLAGVGSPSMGGGATWAQSVAGSTNWTSGGGDYEASATTTIGFSNTYQQETSGSVLTDVQAWFSAPATNFGWILIGNEAVDDTVKWIDTKENSTVADRPKLVVNFTRQLPT